MNNYKQLLNLMKWDVLLLYKYGIIAIAFIISGLYSISLFFFNAPDMEKLVAFLIFSDPVMYGFLFTALIVLFEKNAQIHQIIAITPLPIKYYIISKATLFTLLSLVCSTLIVFASHPANLSIAIFILAIILSALLFVFIGIIGTSFVSNFNQFILLMPIVLAPACFPLLSFFNLYHSWIFYLIPTQACLILFRGSFETLSFWQLCYAISYLLLANIVCYKWAIYQYKIRILKTSRND